MNKPEREGIDMNSREVDAEVRRLATERGWDDWSDGDQRSTMMLLLLNDREDVRRRLLAHIQSLRRDLDHLEEGLRKPSPTLNRLGELQQRPAAVETAVGEFSAANTAFQRYLKTYPAKGE